MTERTIIDVAIIVANRPEYTQVCLEALSTVDHGSGVLVRPIIVDNGSRNKTRTLISEWAAAPSRARLAPLVVTLPNNVGFAAGLNEAIKAADPTRPFLVLHNDAVPFEGAIGEMAWALENGDEDACVVIPRTCYANEGTPCVPELRKRIESIKPSTKDRLPPEEIKALMAKLYPDGEGELIGPTGLLQKLPRTSYSPEISSFCMMVKPGTFSQYGVFDPEFAPRGYEDRYWFQPIERSGGICLMANHSFVHHWGNMTSDGPGYSFPDMMRVNKERFDTKVAARDKAFFARKGV